MKKLAIALLTLVPLSSITAATSVTWGGARSSIYGAVPFPSDTSWTYINRNIAQKTGAQNPAAIWIVGHLDSRDGSCFLEFPRPANVTTTAKNIKFIGDEPDWKIDANDHEATLDFFDANGIKVFLQVEPGMADLPELMDIVMKQYGHHSCVIGFGYDIEWYHVPDDGHVNGGGNGYANYVTKKEALAWKTQLESYNPSHTLFLKHWLPEFVAKTGNDVVNGVLYINDSQGFGYADVALSAMEEEFSSWASYFDPSPVGFQYGYEQDVDWWPNLTDPVGDIAESVQWAIDQSGSDQQLGMFWVDFTLQHKAVSDLWKQNGVVPVMSSSLKKQTPLVALNGRTVTFSEPMKSVQLFSPAGRLIKEISGSISSLAIDGSSAAGVYLIQSTTTTNRMVTTRMAIR